MRRVLPVVLGGLGGVDGHADFLFAYLVVACDDVLVVVGHHHLAHVARADFLAVDDGGDFNDFVGLSFEFLLEFDSLRTAWLVAFYRLVVRLRKCDQCVVHCCYLKI